MGLATPARTLMCLVTFLCLTGLAGAQDIPRSSHVWVINEENHSYEEVIGNTQMPYYNQLVKDYGLATQFYSDQHSSLPALMWFVAGAPVETNNDTTSCDHTEDNVVRELRKHGYSWRAYQEDLPYAGFQGLYGGTDDLYYRRHNPLIDFSDVCPVTGQDTNIVPYTQMAADFDAGNTVNYAWVTPDVLDDAHSSTLQAADAWLQAHIPAILARPEFQPGGDGVLFIVWDESGSERRQPLLRHSLPGMRGTHGDAGDRPQNQTRLSVDDDLSQRKCARDGMRGDGLIHVPGSSADGCADG